MSHVQKYVDVRGKGPNNRFATIFKSKGARHERNKVRIARRFVDLQSIIIIF